ncbi:MAG: AMP-binding protein [Pyrinomonadaceae bacterium]
MSLSRKTHAETGALEQDKEGLAVLAASRVAGGDRTLAAPGGEPDPDTFMEKPARGQADANGAGGAGQSRPAEFGMYELPGRLGELTEQTISYYENNRVRSKTYPEVLADVEAMQAKLESWGVGPRMRIGILSANSYAWIVCDLALLRLRCVNVCFPPDEFAETSLEELGEKYSLHLLMVSGHELKRRGARPEWAALLDQENEEPVRARSRPPTAVGNSRRSTLSDPDLLNMVFSSGSTGRLKCILMSKIGTEEWIVACGQKLTFRPDDSMIVVLPLSHNQQRLMIFMAVWYGFSLVLTDPARLPRALKELKPTILAGPPAFYEPLENRFRSLPRFKQSLLLAGGRVINSIPLRPLRERLSRTIFEPFYSAFGGRMRLMITGGAPSRRSTLELYELLGLPLYQVYGMVEAGFVSVNLPGTNRVGSAGKSMFEGQVEIAPDGEVIVCFERPTSLGYFLCDEGDEERTYLEGHRIATGDIGHFDRDGFLHLTGRKKQIIITPGGYKVQPECLEREIEQCPEVARAVVFGGGELSIIVALVSLRSEDSPGARERVQEAVERLNKTIPSASRVGRVVFTSTQFGIDNGFLNRSLKINRAAVYDAFRQALLGLE